MTDPSSLRAPSVSKVAILVGLLLLAGCGLGEPSYDLVIRNVTLVDAENGVRPGHTVAIEGDAIVVVDSGGSALEGAEVVDGTGRYLIPGLWDMHVHLTYEDALTDAMPGLFLSWGVTSVRDTGGPLEELLPVVQAMRADGATAPRVFFSGPLLDGSLVVYDGEARPLLGISNPTPSSARANVEMLDEAGVDFIKIYELVSPAVFDALVEAARSRGLPIAAHVPLSMRAGQVAPRVGSMEHLRNVELDCASNAERLLAERREILDSPGNAPGADLRAQLHERQRLPAIEALDLRRCRDVLATLDSTIQVPTLRLNAFSLHPPFQRSDWDEALDRAPEDVAREWRAVTAERRANPPSADTTFGAWSLWLVEEMHQQGVPIGAGTDTPINYALPGYSLHSELEMLVRAGLSPLEALGAATVRPAQFFGLEDEMGTIEESKRADLVLLSADPLENITNTRRIEAVISKGRLLRPAG